MTFDDIVNTVMDRLNLTSLDARERIEGFINTRYKRITSSIGLITSRRLIEDWTFDPDDPGSELPDIVITGSEKVLNIKIVGDDGAIRVLKPLLFDELSSMPTLRQTPRYYADKLLGAQQVRLQLDAYPEEPFTLKIESYEIAPELEGTLEPFLPESFHDILISGARADELKKMEKYDKAREAEDEYETRLSDLRMFIARNAYLDVVQGKDRPDEFWYRPWFARTIVVP